jgi:dimethylglycine oxidase
VGPNARELVQSLSEDNLSGEAFGFFKARRIHVREVPVTALRLSCVGELGWELYTTADLGLRLWDLLWEAGQPLGVIAGGRGAFNGLQLEKGYRMWGTDMTTEHDPYEVGYGYRWMVEFEQEADFVGKEALKKIGEEGVSRKLVGVEIGGDKLGAYNDGMMIDIFPVLKDGDRIGQVASACYSPRLDKNIGFAMVPAEYSTIGIGLEVQRLECVVPAVVADRLFSKPEKAEQELTASRSTKDV